MNINNRWKHLVALAGLIVLVLFGLGRAMTHWLASRSLARLQDVSTGIEQRLDACVHAQREGMQALLCDARTVQFFSHIKQSGARGDFSPVIKEYFKENELLDLYFVDSAGMLTWALHKQEMVGHRVDDEQCAQMPLSQTFDLAYKTMGEDISYVTNKMTQGKASVLFSVPLLGNNICYGVLIAEFDADHLFARACGEVVDGKSGEVLFGQNVQERLIYVFPPRLHPSLAFNLAAPHDAALFRAATGYESRSEGIDYRGQRVFAVSIYSVALNVGVVVKQDVREVLFFADLFNAIMFVLLLCMAVIALVMLLATPLARTIAALRRIALMMAGTPWMLFLSLFVGLSIYGLLHSILEVRDVAKKIQNDQRTRANIRFQRLFQSVNVSNGELVSAVKSLSVELKQQLAVSAVRTAITKQLTQLPAGCSILIAEPDGKSVSLWSMEDGQLEEYNLGQHYTYNIDEKADYTKFWYTRALANGFYWTGAFYEPASEKMLIAYAQSFVRTGSEKVGVVAAAWDYDAFAERLLAERSEHLRTLLIIDDQGAFIMPPSDRLVHPDEAGGRHRRLLTNVAGEQYFDEKSLTRKQTATLLESYIKKIEPNAYGYLQDEVSSTGWLCAASFSQSKRILPIGQLTRQWIILALFILLSIFSLLLFYGAVRARFKFCQVDKRFLFILALITGVINLALWGIVYHYSLLYQNDAVTMTQKSDLSRALASFSQEMNENAVIVPTGITLLSINLAEQNQVSFSADVWQIIPHGQEKTLSQGVWFLNAKQIGQELIVRRPHKDGTYLLWKVHATVSLSRDYHFYPFHKTVITISMTARNPDQSIQLVPDFEGYEQLGQRRGWLSPDVRMSGYTVQDSYFEYVRSEGKARAHPMVTEKNLSLVVFCNESLAGVAVVYLIPILLILFLMFTMMWLAPSYRITSYGGIFFSTVLLHRSLRGALDIAGIIYLEYFFFFIYVTLLLLAVAALITLLEGAESDRAAVINFYAQRLYWPVQFMFWIVATVVTFYRS